MFDSIKKFLFGDAPIDADEAQRLQPQPININPPKKVSHVRLLSRLERLYLQQAKTPDSADVNSAIKTQHDMLAAAGHNVVKSLNAVRKELNLLGSE